MRFKKLALSCVILAATVMVGGCDFLSQLKGGLTHSIAAAELIEKQVGKKPDIGFNFQNGTFVRATVQFAQAPAIPLPQLEKVVREAVVHEFEEEPDSLVIAFAYTKVHQ